MSDAHRPDEVSAPPGEPVAEAPAAGDQTRILETRRRRQLRAAAAIEAGYIRGLRAA